MCRLDLLDKGSDVISISSNRTILKAYSIHDAYALTMNNIKNLGVDIVVKDKLTRNLSNVSIDLHPKYDELNNKFYHQKRVYCKNRNLTNKVQDAEFIWFMTFNNSLEPINKYNKNWHRFSDDGKTVNSNYGYWWMLQVYGIIKKIAFDKYTRQAVIQVYDGSMTNNFVSKDIQCTKSIDFKIVPNEFGEDELHMSVDMRSNDAVYGLPIDMFVFASLHELVYSEVALFHENLKLGIYSHNATSMHVYEKDFELMNKGIERMSYERIQQKDRFPSKEVYTTYSTFWTTEDRHYFDRVDRNDFIDYVHNGLMYNAFCDAHAIVDDIMVSEFGRYTSNKFTVEEIMPLVASVVQKFKENDITFPNSDLSEMEMFDRFYYCKNYVGNSILSTTFITNVLMTKEDVFMGFHDRVRSYTDFIRPITKFDVCIAILSTDYTKLIKK